MLNCKMFTGIWIARFFAAGVWTLDVCEHVMSEDAADFEMVRTKMHLDRPQTKDRPIWQSNPTNGMHGHHEQHEPHDHHEWPDHDRDPVPIQIFENVETHDNDDAGHERGDCYWNGHRGRDSYCWPWSTYGLKWFFDDDDRFTDTEFETKFRAARHHSHDTHHQYRAFLRMHADHSVGAQSAYKYLNDDNPEYGLNGLENYGHPHWKHHRKAEIIERRKRHHHSDLHK